MFIVKKTTLKGVKCWGVYCNEVRKFYTKYTDQTAAQNAADALNKAKENDKELRVLRWVDLDKIDTKLN